MKKIHIVALFLFFVALLSLLIVSTHSSCGGGPSGVIGDTVGDTVVISDASSIPTIDISGVDIVSPPSQSISPVKALVVGDPSATGCLAMKFFRVNEFDTLRQTELANCFAKKTQKYASQMSIPANTSDAPSFFRYYEFDVPTGAYEITGIKAFRARLANVVSSTSSKFEMDICQSLDGTSFVRSNEFDVVGNVSTLIWSGTSVAHNPKENDDAFNSASFEIKMKSAANMREEFSWDNVESVNITGHRGHKPSTQDATDETIFDDVFDLTFTYAAVDETIGGPKSSINGAFNSFADGVEGAVYSIYIDVKGASQASYDNGQGVYKDVQAYNPKDEPPKIIDSMGVDFYNDVVSAVLPSTDFVEGIKQSVKFTRLWDCEASENRTFVKIDASTFDFSECSNMVTALVKPDINTMIACFGGENLAGNYNAPTGPPLPCPSFASSYALTGVGPAYTAGSEPEAIQFVYQNTYCSNASVGGIPCTSCGVTTTGGVDIEFNECGDTRCDYLIYKMP